MDADSLLNSGDIEGARAVLVERLRSQPADERARMFLFQLLCVTGDWDKARSQLEMLAKLSPEAQMLSVVYGQVIAAEQARIAVFAGQRPMEMLVESPWASELAQAFSFHASGDAARAADLRDAALDQAPDTPGTLDGVDFDWIADADSRWGPTFEVIMGGSYGIVAFDAFESIKSEGPQDLRDKVWYPVQLAFRSGQSTAAFLPVRYPGSERSEDPAERLANATGWKDSPAGEVGSGQHLWMISTGDETGLLSARSLTFR